MTHNKTVNIAIFISGAGSNARNIIMHFKNKKNVNTRLLLSNKPENGANNISSEENIEMISFTKDQLINSNSIIEALNLNQIDFIVLAGFLLKIPENLVYAFPNKIINIHPALLPKYGGKGMYGKNVHKAVFENKEKESGITIHYVNEHYDEGSILAQFKCTLSESDTALTIEQKVRDLEKENFAKTIEKLINDEI